MVGFRALLDRSVRTPHDSALANGVIFWCAINKNKNKEQMNNARRLGFAFVDTAVQPVTSIENHVMAITDSWTQYSNRNSVCDYLKQRLIHSVQLDAFWGAEMHTG